MCDKIIIHCPKCQHHLVGYFNQDNLIEAYCPLCEKIFIKEKI